MADDRERPATTRFTLDLDILQHGHSLPSSNRRVFRAFPAAFGQTGQMNEPTLQIGAVAEQTGLSVRTLRHYEDVGLVRPSA